MPGVLLDTHALYWLVSGEKVLSEAALVAIGESQDAGALYVSPITAWELSLAAKKADHAGRPDFGEAAPDRWFREAVRAVAAKIVPIHNRVSCEAAHVVTATGHKDPGDCFLIATARVRNISLVTRDRSIKAIAAGEPGFLEIVEC